MKKLLIACTCIVHPAGCLSVSTTDCDTAPPCSEEHAIEISGAGGCLVLAGLVGLAVALDDDDCDCCGKCCCD